jgi:UrcA family protein
MKSPFLLASLAGAMTLCLAAPAQSQERIEEVHFGDLNLLSETGQDQLEKRLRTAVRHVCGTTSAAQADDLRTKLTEFSCRRDSLSAALLEKDVVIARVKAGELTRGKEVAMIEVSPIRR